MAPSGLDSAIRVYLKFLSICFLVGGILHLLDLFDLRLQFSEMNIHWKIWTLYLLIFDFFAAFGLWRNTRWGRGLFLFIAFSQLIAYGFFQDQFGAQPFLIAFHLVTVGVYLFLQFLRKRKQG